jgi:hypothetical protein
MSAIKKVRVADDGSMTQPSSAVLYVSIVSAADGACFTVVSTSENECVTRVASYVAEQAPLQLWPPAARRVRELLASGDAAAAVAHYFRRSGERWDREWLVTASLNAEPGSSTWSGAIPLPGPLNWGGLSIGWRSSSSSVNRLRGSKCFSDWSSLRPCRTACCRAVSTGP